MMRDDHLSVRVPADLKSALQRLADAEQRTLASYVHHVLHQHVERVDGPRSAKSAKLRKA
jgi:predicted DNA-binding protein